MDTLTPLDSDFEWSKMFFLLFNGLTKGLKIQDVDEKLTKYFSEVAASYFYDLATGIGLETIQDLKFVDEAYVRVYVLQLLSDERGNENKMYARTVIANTISIFINEDGIDIPFISLKQSVDVIGKMLLTTYNWEKKCYKQGKKKYLAHDSFESFILLWHRTLLAIKPIELAKYLEGSDNG